MPGGGPGGYPPSVKTAAQRALYNNLGKDEVLALAVDQAVQGSRQDGWRGNAIKVKKVRLAIKEVFLNPDVQPSQSTDVSNENKQEEPQAAYIAKPLDEKVDLILELVKNQGEY
jgi:type I restriction enzyme R subunit